MFHRVKSDAEKKQDIAAQSQENPAVQRPVAEPSSAPIQNNQTTTSTKETQEMNNTVEQPEALAPEQAQATPAYTAPSTARAPAYQASSYNGGYSAPASTQSDDVEERRLVIGRGITVSGEIEACDYLLVEGTIEAALKGAKSLEISESGTFYGTVEIDEAVVSGRFEGDLTVNGRLTISATGTITGSISYRELDVQAGAVIDGKLTPIRAQAPAASKPAATTPAKTADKSAKEAAALAKARELKAQSEQPQPANTDGELFAEATAAAE